MSCPDNLLVGHRKGVLSEEEAVRLEAHLARCPTCQLTLQVGAEFDDVLQTMPGDDLIAARFARNLGPTFDKQRTARQSSLLRHTWVAAAALAFFASAGLAAARLGAWPFEQRAAAPAPRVAQVRTPVRTEQAPKLELEPAPEVVTEPTVEAPPEEAAPRQVERVPSAAALFAQANEQRRAGELTRALRLYRELQQHHPRSPEVQVSHVSLGRVLLELEQARAALEQFERYLTRLPRGPLAEEALFGKASALERLARATEERRTWQALLATFPNSMYAERARQRLQRLP